MRTIQRTFWTYLLELMKTCPGLTLSVHDCVVLLVSLMRTASELHEQEHSSKLLCQDKKFNRGLLCISWASNPHACCQVVSLSVFPLFTQVSWLSVPGSSFLARVGYVPLQVLHNRGASIDSSRSLFTCWSPTWWSQINFTNDSILFMRALGFLALLSCMHKRNFTAQLHL